MVPVELPRPNPDVISRRLDDEIVLVHLKTNQIYALNETGARLWELLTDGLDRPAIEARLQAEYAVEPAVVGAEIDRILARLAAVGAVRPA